MKEILIVCLAAVMIGPHAAAAADYPVRKIIRPPETYKTRSTWIGPVDFPHAVHARHTACGLCHHMETDRTTKNREYMDCSSCHNKEERPGETGFYGAWHSQSERSCLGCHMTRPVTDEGKPPRGCTTGCHKFGDEKDKEVSREDTP